MLMNYFNKNLYLLEGYVPGLQLNNPALVKLNTNENPYSAPRQVLQNLKNSINEGLRLYPNPVSLSVRQKIADFYGFNENQVLVGNGSDDLLRMIVQSSLGFQRKILLTDPTYSLYPILAQIQGAEIEWVQVGLDSIFPEILPKADVFIFACPNAPTGSCFQKEQIIKILNQFQGLVVIDEAYADFAEFNCLDLVDQFENLIVTRTMSKSFSLAGLRIGYAFSNKENILQLDKVRDSYNVNSLSQIAAVSCFDEIDTIQLNIQKIINERILLAQFLKENDFKVINSHANFIFASAKWMDALVLYQQLLDNNILVRHFPGPLLDAFIRITIGPEYQMNLLKDVILKIKKKRG